MIMMSSIDIGKPGVMNVFGGKGYENSTPRILFYPCCASSINIEIKYAAGYKNLDY